MKFELSLEEARFLKAQLTRHLDELGNEMVHTDKRQMHRALAVDVEQLTSLARRLEVLIDSEAIAAPGSAPATSITRW